MDHLVSVIMPAYNCEDYIEEAINSVINQTYKKWELIIVDDASTDGTLQIIDMYIKKDKRIKKYLMSRNLGAAAARNKAIAAAKGKYLAFLDSDDLWRPQKLEKQIEFMEKNHYSFTCTAYGKMNEHGIDLKKVMPCRQKYNYEFLLRECFGNSTVIYDAAKLGKVYGENVRKRNDFAMWLKVIKIAQKAYGLNEVLGYHRVRNGSISYNKKDLVKYQWYVYRKIEKLSMYKCILLMCNKILQTISKVEIKK